MTGGSVLLLAAPLSPRVNRAASYGSSLRRASPLHEAASTSLAVPPTLLLTETLMGGYSFHFEHTIWLAHWLTDDTLRKVPLKCFSFFFFPPHFSREKASLLPQGRIWVPWKALSWVCWKLSFHHHDLSLQRGQGSCGLSAVEWLSHPPLSRQSPKLPVILPSVACVRCDVFWPSCCEWSPSECFSHKII